MYMTYLNMRYNWCANADVHEEARWQRLANARKKDQSEDDAVAAATAAEADKGKGRGESSKHGHFMKTATRELYGAEGGGGSVQDQIGRRKYYSERGASDKAAFRR